MTTARSVIVTGSSSGIGAATAEAFGRKGYRVVLGARREDRLANVVGSIEKAGGEAFAHRLDVSDTESIDAFVEAATRKFGPPDVLINNAGLNRSALAAEATDEDLREDVEVNLLGPMFLTRRVLPAMIESRSGDVVFVGSDSAVRPRTYQGAYSAAKAGLEIFSRVVEMETEGTGVRSMLIRVGPTGSEFGSQMPQDKLPEILESWKYWGALRHLHWMPAEAVAAAIVRAVEVPVDELYQTVVEVQPGGRSRDFEE